MGAILNKRAIKNILSQDINFGILTEFLQEKWINRGELIKQKKGKKVYEKGKKIENLIILLKGSISDASGNVTTMNNIVASDYLLNILDKSSKSKPDQNFTMTADGEIFKLNIGKLQKLLNGEININIAIKESLHYNCIYSTTFDPLNELTEYTFEDFDYIKEIESESNKTNRFRAFLVYCRSKKEYYLIKQHCKQFIRKFNGEHRFVDMKDFQPKLSFPLMISAERTFKDNEFIYFCYNYYNGITLFDAQRNMSVLNNRDAAIYVGQLLLAIEYLHSKKIIHRGLKPENVLVGKRGELKIREFFTAKLLKTKDKYLFKNLQRLFL